MDQPIDAGVGVDPEDLRNPVALESGHSYLTSLCGLDHGGLTSSDGFSN